MKIQFNLRSNSDKPEFLELDIVQYEHNLIEHGYSFIQVIEFNNGLLQEDVLCIMNEVNSFVSLELIMESQGVDWTWYSINKDSVYKILP